MASNVINTGLNLMNTAYNGAGGIVLSGDAVKGGYFVTDTIANIPSWSNVKGTLCYCTGDSKFYQYNGTSWAEAAFSGASGDISITKVNGHDDYKGEIYAPVSYTEAGYVAVSTKATDGATTYNASQFIKPRGISVNGAVESATNNHYYTPVIADSSGKIANEDLGDLTIYAPTEAGSKGQVIFADENGIPTWGTIDTSDIDDHVKRVDNPHKVTKAQVELGNVTNVATTSTITANSNLNITSGAVYTALQGKANTTHTHDNTYSKIGHTHIGHTGTASGTARKVWTYNGTEYAWETTQVDDGELSE